MAKGRRILVVSTVEELIELDAGTRIDGRLVSSDTDSYWEKEDNGEWRLHYLKDNEMVTSRKTYRSMSAFFKDIHGRSIVRAIYSGEDE